MVQRLGRVNRRGGAGRLATIEVVAAPPPGKEKKDEEKWPDRFARLRKPIDALNGDASPAAIVALREDESQKEALLKAQTPAPLRPALTRALVDAWSMTSLEEHTGRPEVEPWLRGWVENDEPQTAVVWRKYLPVVVNGEKPAVKKINEFFDEAPPQTSEVLQGETWHIGNWLLARVKAVTNAASKHGETNAAATFNDEDIVLFILNAKDELDSEHGARGQWTLRELAELGSKENDKETKSFLVGLTGRTLVVSSLIGGLDSDGMLDAEIESEPSPLDADETWDPVQPFRARETSERSSATDGNWRETCRFPIARTEDGDDTRWIVIEQARDKAQSEEDRAIARYEQTLQDHQRAAEGIARAFARKLNLPADYSDMLAVAARLHDEGKRASRWQRSFKAPAGNVYAKTKGPINFKLLDGYRHEFGSLPYVENDPVFKALPAELQDLALHLVAAHHGQARPVIETRSCDDAPPTTLTARARDTALRFARLQKRWGPWGLAWWEALLRAADQQASRENDEREKESGEGRKPGEAG
jgi:CRISPR-associated endonuclease/helicase Cas3